MEGRPVLEFDAVLKHFTTAMMVTHSDKGLHARPMHVLKVLFSSGTSNSDVIRDQVSPDHSVWVASQLHCAKCQEIQKDSEVLLTLQGVGRWLSLNGTAEIVADKKTKDSLWTEGLKVSCYSQQITPKFSERSCSVSAILPEGQGRP